jgi:predicted deacylase
MRTRWEEGEGRSGVNRGWIDFEHPMLEPYRWPLIEVKGLTDGPQLCVMAGVHVNEASSIEAAIRLPELIDVAAVRGRISIIPIVNQPAQYHYTEKTPIDGKNMHWLYPGDPRGTFSDVLANRLLNEWAGCAAALIDLHGGDIGEVQEPYVVLQRTGDAAFNAQLISCARCFTSQFIVCLGEQYLASPGRSCSALARFGRVGLVTEAGDHAVIQEDAVLRHGLGVLNVARLLGVLNDRPAECNAHATVIEEYVFVTAPVAGLFYPISSAGQWIRRREPFGELRDNFGRKRQVVLAPCDGVVLWHSCLQFAKAEAWIGAIGQLGSSVAAEHERAYGR